MYCIIPTVMVMFAAVSAGSNGQPRSQAARGLVHSISMYSKDDLKKYKHRFVERLPSICSNKTDTDTEIGE